MYDDSSNKSTPHKKEGKKGWEVYKMGPLFFISVMDKPFWVVCIACQCYKRKLDGNRDFLWHPKLKGVKSYTITISGLEFLKTALIR